MPTGPRNSLCQIIIFIYTNTFLTLTIVEI